MKEEPSCTWHWLTHAQTQRFSKLFIDYLNGDAGLRPFYVNPLAESSFEFAMENRSHFPREQRHVLQEVLQEQYADVPNTAAVQAQIKALGSEQAFTVTTGQQLCLFSGPLYVIYKAVQVIALANRLNQLYPDHTVIPVFWLATEDHDFDEVNHVDIMGKRFQTTREGEGAVGRSPLPDLQTILEALEKHLGPGKKQAEIMQQLREAYGTPGISWTAATRRFLHSLFGTHGLLLLDADDARLKQQMIPVFSAELLEGKAAKHLMKRSEELDQQYKVQAFPREINLFYLTDQRKRILREGEEWTVDGNPSLRWNRNTLLQELQAHPERFSPNVLLRPLYQEIILPNLGYIGGGAELAYWMQLGEMFDAFDQPMPVIVPRQSVQIMTAAQNRRRLKAGLRIEELFAEDDQLIKDHVHKHSSLDLHLSEYVKRTMQNFDEIYAIAQQTDKSMIGAVEAQRTKQLKGLENLKKKLLRAEKRQFAVEVNRIETLLDELFPNGGLQERRMNWIEAELLMGGGFINELIASVEPLGRRFALLQLLH